MAEGRPIFNRQATERLHNPDDLDRYVRVARPSAWILLVACVLLVGGLIVWGLFGTVNVNVNSTGVRIDDHLYCFLSSDDGPHTKVGDVARMGDVQVRVASVSVIPLSPDEVKAIVGSDYLVSTLTNGEDWVFEVLFEGDDIGSLPEGVPLSTSITAEKVTPFDMAFGAKG